MARRKIYYLTKGERLWLWGRRWRKNSTAIAEFYSVTTTQVGKWIRAMKDDKDIPEVALTEPIKEWEILAIARRRVGISIDRLAAKQGISHVTLISRERGKGNWRASWRWWKGKLPPPPITEGKGN